MKRAIITGITGQDGSYLAEQLLDKGYEVHGIVRRSSSFNTERIDHLYRDPHEERRAPAPAPRRPRATPSASCACVYEIAARRDLPPRRAVARPRLLRRPRVHQRRHRAWARCACSRRSATRASRPRFYQASSSEMFGAVAAAAGRGARRFIRAARTPWRRSRATGSPSTTASPTGCFASNGILFNHESERRGETFVTRKITRALARDPARPAGQALPRQPRRPARLGLRAGLRRRDVAHAPAGRARRLRDRHRRDALRARVPRRGRVDASGWTGKTSSRSTRATTAPPRSTPCCGDAVEGAREARLGADGDVQGARADHGRADVKALEDRLAGRGVRVGRE